jgi:hypothetical protein
VSSGPTEESDDTYCNISNMNILQTIQYFRARIRTQKMETESDSESVHLNNMTPSETAKTCWSLFKRLKSDYDDEIYLLTFRITYIIQQNV